MITAIPTGHTVQELASHSGVVGELADLLADIAGKPHELSEGARERRVAELLELLDLDAAARGWWREAASLGDIDAIEYLEVLEEEQDGDDAEFQAAPPRGSGRRHSELERRLILLLNERRTVQGSGVLPADPQQEDLHRCGDVRSHLRCRDPLPSAAHRSPTGVGHSDACQGDSAVQNVRAAAEQLVREIEAHLASPESLAGGRGADRRGPGSS